MARLKSPLFVIIVSSAMLLLAASLIAQTRGGGGRFRGRAASAPADGNLPSTSQPSSRPAGQRVFLLSAPIRDLATFEKYAEQMARLKPYGRVEIEISTPAVNADYEVPPGGSPWHEYCKCLSAPYKFFPDQRLAPFIPADFVAKNQAFLAGEVQILRKYGFGASFRSYEPNFLPEPFFQKYPELRGPRTDHPRRSRQEAYAPCVDEPEVQQMISDSMALLVKAVPELTTYSFKTNDAGPGLCWADKLYTWPNGPAHCQNVNVGTRMRSLVDAINKGVEQGGGKPLSITIDRGTFFTDSEVAQIIPKLPDNCSMGGRGASLGSPFNSMYPCKGIFDPLRIISSLQGGRRGGGGGRYTFSFGACYNRGVENLVILEKTIDVVEAILKDPPASGTIPRLQYLQKLCIQWVGPEQADRLMDAFISLDDTLTFGRAALSGFSSEYCGVTMRHITRPLVAMPEKLTPDEEKFFLPYVFNPSVNEGRMDYIDFHGGRMHPSWVPVRVGDSRMPQTNQLVSRLGGISRTFESFADSSIGPVLQGSAKSLRFYGCVMKSINHFYFAQLIRDKNKDKLAGKPMTYPPEDNYEGDSDLRMLTEIMREEMDNTTDMIAILENGGMDVVCHADKPEQEDTFILGPNLINQLKQKRDVMRAHWRDAESYLVTPLK